MVADAVFANDRAMFRVPFALRGHRHQGQLSGALFASINFFGSRHRITTTKNYMRVIGLGYAQLGGDTVGSVTILFSARFDITFNSTTRCQDGTALTIQRRFVIKYRWHPARLCTVGGLTEHNNVARDCL